MPDPTKYPIDAENASQVPVGASAIVLAANPARLGADFVNISDPIYAITLGFGHDAIDMTGKVLTTKGSTYHMGTDNLFTGDIYAVCPDGGLLSISEEVKVS